MFNCLINYIKKNNKLPSYDLIKNDLHNISDINSEHILFFIIRETKYKIPKEWIPYIDINIVNIENMNIPMYYIIYRKRIPSWMLKKNINWNHLEMANHNLQMIYIKYSKKPLNKILCDNIQNINHQNVIGETIPMLYLKYYSPTLLNYKQFIHNYKINKLLHDDNMLFIYDYINEYITSYL